MPDSAMDQSQPVTTVSVRELAEFCYRSGDIDHRFTPSPTGVQGTEGHQRVFRKRPDSYHSEFPVEYLYARQQGQLLLRGRADGYDSVAAMVEEIKTCRVNPAVIPDSVKEVHLAQAKLYAALVAQQEGREQLEVRLTWFNIDSDQEWTSGDTYCAGQLALSGKDDVRKAGGLVSAFLKANEDSYHYLDAQMLYGDLGAAAGSPSAAQGAYMTVGKMAPWPDYKARAAVALGNSYLAAGDTGKASSMFKSALGMSDPSPEVQRQKLAATLGEAQCLAADGKVDDAAKSIQDVIKQADNDDLPLLAKAHNALGASYRTAKRPKDALMAYLWVDLVYFNSPQDHIEALENLVQLWNEQQMPERSTEAAQTLRERYNRSPR